MDRLTTEPNWSRIAERVARALRQAYGTRVREVNWKTTQPKLMLDVELLGPVDVYAETMRMSDATYEIVVEEGVTIICKPVEAGKELGP